MATKKEIAALFARLGELRLKGALTEVFIEECARAWSSVPLGILEDAAREFVLTNVFLPRIAELQPLITARLARERDASIIVEDNDPLTPEEMFEIEVTLAHLAQPPCVECRAQGGFIWDGDEYLPPIMFSRLYPSRRDGLAALYTPCVACRGRGHEPLDAHEIARIRARFFPKPQVVTTNTTTTRRKEQVTQ